MPFLARTSRFALAIPKLIKPYSLSSVGDV